MALPAHLQETFSSEEVRFLVENEPIKIFPRITTKTMARTTSNNTKSHTNNDSSTRHTLITMNKFPLNEMIAMKSMEVSLWLALLLKQQNKCNIIIPEWLTVNSLDRYVKYETKYSDRFSSLPWNWLVLSKILFEKAYDDFNDPVNELRQRIQDLRELRQVKVLKGLSYLNESHLQLDNLSLTEINELRPFIVGTMNKLREVHSASLDHTETNEGENLNIDEDASFGSANYDGSRMVT
ncbi:hypothetical protein KAFR_0A01630 [Kazachstania africana CBS 2517]|uniref:DNA replication complex GINS protein PSF2 n=1 Tax=Kazachstania africana (strain ATCC 22294 / BCRC 22015 / CBS 2517 / CECT 1963 / NBRC 1671 / NRRL Y-8276) TaxID=1071382 RepID=H2AMK1_KAZAF|nr:hypothetical protein KAFR_0A01630 [Kazachstania africana CBS 2517]CCF55601.1 hypothetical protein KAFR_0A01630 [Kazachstania africana CBS 2517]